MRPTHLIRQSSSARPNITLPRIDTTPPPATGWVSQWVGRQTYGDYYLYDADEFGVGLSAMFCW